MNHLCIKSPTFRNVLLLIFLFMTTAHLYAEVPNEFSYTGRIREYGLPVTGQRTVCFKLYSQEQNGTPIWMSDNTTVAVSSGVFSCRFVPEIDWRTKDVWMEITVGNITIPVREKLCAQAYARHAATAEDVSKQRGTISFSIGTSTYMALSPSSLVISTSTAINGALGVAGAVQASSVDVANTLVVHGNARANDVTVQSLSIGTSDIGTDKLRVDGNVYSTGTITAAGGDSRKWNAAYDERKQWDGSTTNLDARVARSSLGLGTMAVQSSTNVAITGGTLSGISSLCITGNVGIGTTNPLVNLHVKGVLDADEIRIQGKPVGTSMSSYWLENGQDIYYSHNVAIGKTTPESALDVLGTMRATHYRDSTGQTFMRSSNNSITVAEDSDGSYDLKIGNASIGTNELKVPSAGIAGQTLASNGDGTLTWQTMVDTSTINELQNVFTTIQSQTGDTIYAQNLTDTLRFTGTGIVNVVGNAVNNTVTIAATEADPKVGENILNAIPKWNGTALVAGTIVDKDGNIGIGTTSPQSLLDVRGAVRAKQFRDIAGSPLIASPDGSVVISERANGGYDLVAIDTSTTNEIQNMFQSISVPIGQDIVAHTSTTTLTMRANGIVSITGNAADDSITFSALEADPKVGVLVYNTVPRWNGVSLVTGTITDMNGNIGIGTTNPASTLDVAGTLRAQHFRDTTGDTLVRADNATVNVTEDENGAFLVKVGTKTIGTDELKISGTGTTDQVLYSNGDSSFVWKTLPTREEQNIFRTIAVPLGENIVAHSSTTTVTFVSSGMLTITGDASLDRITFTAVETDPKVGANLLNAMPKWNGSALIAGSITDNGNIGIGTTSPQSLLDVRGALRAKQFRDVVGNPLISSSDNSVNITENQNGSFDCVVRDTSPANEIQNIFQTVCVPYGQDIVAHTSTTTLTFASSGIITITGDASSDRITFSAMEVDPKVGVNLSNAVPKWNGTTLIESAMTDVNGNIGIGTITPNSMLDVRGALRASNYRDTLGNTLIASSDRSVSVTENQNGRFDLVVLDTSPTNEIQNIFQGVQIPNGDTVVAHSSTTILKLAANGIVNITGDVTNDRITLSAVESDPKVSVTTLNAVPRWNGVALVTSTITDLNGNIGIGTPVPNSALDVKGTLRAMHYRDTNGNLLLRSSDGTVAIVEDATGSFDLVTSPPTSKLQNIFQRIAVPSGQDIIAHTSTTTLTLVAAGMLTITGNASNDSITFNAVETDPKVGPNVLNAIPKWNGTALVAGAITDNDGNIGIGTTTPQSLLDVRGALRARQFRDTAGNPLIASTNNSVVVTENQDGRFNLVVRDTSPINEIQNIFQSIQTPTGNMVVAHSSTTVLNLASGGILTITGDAANDRITLSAVESDPKVAVNVLNAVPRWNGVALATGTITDKENKIGIGTTNPQSLLDVYGELRAAQYRDTTGALLVRKKNNTIDIEENDNGAFLVKVATKTISADELKISGNGVVGQALFSNGDGTFVWSSFPPSDKNAQDLFLFVDAPLGDDPMAKSSTDTLKLLSGGIVTITGNGAQNSLTISATETDPKVATTALNAVPKWNGTALVASTILDTNGNVGIGTTTPDAVLHVGNWFRVKNTGAVYVGDDTSSSGVLNVNKNANAATFLAVLNPNTGTSAASAIFVGESVSQGMYGMLSYQGQNFSGEGSTGLYKPRRLVLEADYTATNGLGLGAVNANGLITFYTGGYTNETFERMRITSTGNVGIGTTIPAAKLDVRGTVALNGNWLTYNGNNEGVKIASDGNVYVSGANKNIFVALDNTGITGTGSLTLQAGTSAGGALKTFSHSHATKPGWVSAGISTSSNGKFSVNSKSTFDGTDLFVVEQAGNVGIGTTSPTEKLEVAGNIKTAGTISASTGSFSTAITAPTINLTSLHTGAGTFDNTLIVNGSVGIGTTVPTEKLHVIGNAKISTSVITPKVTAADANGLALYDDGNNGIFVKDGGNVGIGTVSPSQKLDVAGSAKVSTSLITPKVTASDANGLALYDDGNNGIVVKNGGNVGIGTTNIDKNRVHIVGGSVSVNPTGIAEHHAVGGISIQHGGSAYPNRALQIMPAATTENPSYVIHAAQSGTTAYWWTYGVNTDNSFHINRNADAVAGSDFVIAANGNVGIGTTSPSQKLEVVGSAKVSTSLITPKVTASDANGLALYDDGNNGIFVKDGGNVGIGTTNPSRALDVYNGYINTLGIIFTSHDSMRARLAKGNDISGGWDTDDFVIDVGAANFRIGSIPHPDYFFLNMGSGNVGIGTTNPSQKLEVVGSAKVSTSLITPKVTASDANGLALYDDGNNGIFVKDGGSVGIGTTNPQATLDVAGNISAAAFGKRLFYESITTGNHDYPVSGCGLILVYQMCGGSTEHQSYLGLYSSDYYRITLVAIANGGNRNNLFTVTDIDGEASTSKIRVAISGASNEVCLVSILPFR